MGKKKEREISITLNEHHTNEKRFNLFEHYSHIYYCVYKTFVVINDSSRV
jgi:hypothetical protein